MIVEAAARPLPAMWDGVHVTWNAWSFDRSTLILHLPDGAFACGACGAIDESAHAAGKRDPEPGATFPYDELRTTKKSGYKYYRKTTVPAWPVLDLHASRCRHCGHDTVYDQRTNEVWDLEPSDYGPLGSVK